MHIAITLLLFLVVGGGVLAGLLCLAAWSTVALWTLAVFGAASVGFVASVLTFYAIFREGMF